MYVGTALFLIAVGAILRWAVIVRVAGFDIRTAGSRSGRAKLDSLVGDTASGRTPRRSTKNAKKTTTQPLASL